MWSHVWLKGLTILCVSRKVTSSSAMSLLNVPSTLSVSSCLLTFYNHTDATDWNQITPLCYSALEWTVWPSGRSDPKHSMQDMHGKTSLTRAVTHPSRSLWFLWDLLTWRLRQRMRPPPEAIENFPPGQPPWDPECLARAAEPKGSRPPTACPQRRYHKPQKGTSQTVHQ